VSEACRELEPWEIVARDNLDFKASLKRVQHLTEIREAQRARSSLKYHLQSIESYFEHCEDRAEWNLHKPKESETP
jgi:hypothetical protein